MRLNLQELKTFVLYFLAGVIGLSLAVYVSSVFFKRTFAQTPPPPDASAELPPLPDPNAPGQAPSASPPPAAQQQQLPPPPPPPQEAQMPNLPPPPAEAPSSQAPPTQNQQEGNTLRSLLEGIIEDFNYEVSGRRDPFLPYTSPKAISVEEEEEIVSPLQRFELDQLKLIGIIWDTKKPKAMFLDPAGKGYIVGKLDKVGRNRGYIAEIREGEVIILERFVGEGRSTFQTRSIRLERD